MKKKNILKWLDERLIKIKRSGSNYNFQHGLMKMIYIDQHGEEKHIYCEGVKDGVESVQAWENDPAFE